MIFLGQASNYSCGRALRHLFACGTKRSSEQLRQALAERYVVESERVALYHTGRSALCAAIKATLPAGSKVIVPGLTCIAVVRAVRAAGCEVVYADIGDDLQYDLKSLDKTLKVCYNGGIIVQNTLGITFDVAELKRRAEQYHVTIIEDLAHCAGRHYPDGSEVGTIGDAVALSFGKNKAIDTISGGAAIVRRGAEFGCASTFSEGLRLGRAPRSGPRESVIAQPGCLVQPTQRPQAGDRWRDRWYPVLGWMMRAATHVGLRKIMTGAFLKFHWIQRSADAELDLDVRLTHWQAKLARRQLESLDRVEQGPLREYRLVPQREELLQRLEQKGYYLCEIWYDTPVSPVRYAAEAEFPEEQCPETVRIAREIINLPTWYSEKKLAPVRQMIDEWCKDREGAAK